MADDSKSSGFWKTAPGVITALAGILTAVAGLILALYQSGLLGGVKPPIANASQSSVTSTPSPGGDSPARSGPQSNKPADGDTPDVNISGIWHDNLQVRYEIRQQGNEFSGIATQGAFVSTGRGTIIGHEYNSTYSTNQGASGQCHGIVSQDGKTMTGNCRDTIYGDYSVILRRDQ